MSEIRTGALRKLIWVVLGAFLFLLLQKEKGVLLYIGLAGLVFAGWHLLQLFAEAQFIYDDFFPPQIIKEEKPLRINRLLYNAAFVFFFAGGILFIIERNSIENTVRGMSLVWWSLGAGIVLFLLLIILYKKISNTVFFEAKRRFGIYSGLLLGCIMLAPATAGLLNRQLAQPGITCREYIVVEKTIPHRDRSAYIYCRINNRKERFKVSKKFVQKIEEDRPVQFCMVKGFFGYEYVQEVKLPG